MSWLFERFVRKLYIGYNILPHAAVNTLEESMIEMWMNLMLKPFVCKLYTSENILPHQAFKHFRSGIIYPIPRIMHLAHDIEIFLKRIVWR